MDLNESIFISILTIKEKLNFTKYERNGIVISIVIFKVNINIKTK